MYRLKQKLIVCILLIGCLSWQLSCLPSIGMVIFSYNRALQLNGLLDSIAQHVDGLDYVTVIFRASTDEHQHAYRQIMEQFVDVKFVLQQNAPSDFKPILINELCAFVADFVIFAVDDIVVKSAIDLRYCVSLLESTGAYGFYLRLGTNIQECYSAQSCFCTGRCSCQNAVQAQPEFTSVTPCVIKWRFDLGQLDWNYPNNVDMTLYRMQDVCDIVKSLHYNGPNLFESAWSGMSRQASNEYGICFHTSKVVNIPMNRVQAVWHNRSMNLYSPDDLLHIYNSGSKLDIKLLSDMCNRSAHMDYEPSFVDRNGDEQICICNKK